MSTVTTESFAALQQKLFGLLKPHRGSVIMQRLQSFMIEKSGGMKIPEFLNSQKPIEEKAPLVEQLIAILEAQDWDKLPAAPGGQATTNSEPPPAPKKPAPAAPPPAPKPATPPVTPPPAPALVKPAIVPAPPPVVEEAPVPDAFDLLGAAIAELRVQTAKAKQPAPISDAEVRKIVRAELADILSKIAEVLRN